MEKNFSANFSAILKIGAHEPSGQSGPCFFLVSVEWGHELSCRFPLHGILVTLRTPLALNLQYPFVHLDLERYCECKQHNVPGKTTTQALDLGGVDRAAMIFNLMGQ